MAQAQLVGSDQLPIRAPGLASIGGTGPALNGEPSQRAFTVTTAECDWGVVIAVNKPGDVARCASANPMFPCVIQLQCSHNLSRRKSKQIPSSFTFTNPSLCTDIAAEENTILTMICETSAS